MIPKPTMNECPSRLARPVAAVLTAVVLLTAAVPQPSWAQARSLGMGMEMLPTTPFTFLPDTGNTLPGQACEYDLLHLPPRFAVMAAGADSGRPQTIQIDGSGEEAGRIDLAVNSPRIPVVLMLFARGPTIWNIGWSPGTHILAVYASGDGRQTVAGIHPEIPLLISTNENNGPCEAKVLSSANPAEVKPLALRLFNHDVDQVVFPIRNGHAMLGDRAEPGTTFRTRTDSPPDQWRTPQDTPLLEGLGALYDGVRRGWLRRATASDAKAWLRQNDLYPGMDHFMAQAGSAVRPGDQRGRHRIPLTPSTFVVTGVGGRATWPPGLTGTQAAIFIIPQGVARPVGDPGHSTVYDFNTLTCVGPACVF